MDATTPSDPRKTLATGFVTVALVEGAVLVTGVVLLVLDVIPFGIFLAIVVVCMVGAAAAILAVVRRVHRQSGGASPGGTVERPSSDSTIDPDRPFQD
jgi:hypothetical protein